MFINHTVGNIFPELKKSEKENEDEKIMEELISLVKYTKGRRIGYEPHITQDEMIAWLEKQSHMLNPDKVIEWLNEQACCGFIEDVEVDKFINKFKKDFEL